MLGKFKAVPRTHITYLPTTRRARIHRRPPHALAGARRQRGIHNGGAFASLGTVGPSVRRYNRNGKRQKKGIADEGRESGGEDKKQIASQAGERARGIGAEIIR